MKKEFIQQFDIFHQKMDIHNPLTVGNGDFAFTCDITGLQTFYREYIEIPLCTMTNLIWGQQKGEGELPFKEYKKASTNDSVFYQTNTESPTYDNYRDDWFKFDLFKLGFYYNGVPLDIKKISDISQHLSLYDGILYSRFRYENEIVIVETKVPQNHNHLRIKVTTQLKHLQLRMYFLEPSSNIFGASQIEDSKFIVKQNTVIRTNKLASYKLYYKTNMSQKKLWFDCSKNSYIFIGLEDDFSDDDSLHEYFALAKDIDTKDIELNRRMVLSLYLLKVNTLGIYPPSETGLTCNSWYGKFHLEMHLWHHLGIIRFGLYKYVLPSLKWYLSLYNSSKKRAEEQGYAGIRFPKMTDPRGLDTPSTIGCLLIWQMPHLFVMLDEIRRQDSKVISLEEYFPLLIGLIDFMSSFYYLKDGVYHLDSPLIPANENVEFSCDTPIFEECYTLYAFTIFAKWVKEYSIDYDLTRINDILLHYVPLEIKNNCYEAYIGCVDTYTKYNHDHPMMIGMYSYFESFIVNPKVIWNSLQKILDCWSFDDTWGWDFPMLAMTAHRLGDKALALNILKKDALKNSYLRNGHNPQHPKQDLPVYLPGNGAFLLAITHLFDEVNYEN